MAESKNSFILYTDLIHTVEKMPLEKAGELFLTILQYVNDRNPVVEDLIVELVFEPVKQQLKRDLLAWEEIKVERAKSGYLGGVKSGESRRKKQTKQVPQKRSKLKQNEANEAVNVNVSVNDTVDVLNTESLIINSSIVCDSAAVAATHTQEEVKRFNSFKKWLSENAPNVLKMKEPFTIQQHVKLKKDFGNRTDEVLEILKQMHNKAGLTKSYISANLTLRNWIKNKKNGTHIEKLGTSGERVEALKNWGT